MLNHIIKTPIAFFIFNRPDTTSKVFEAIRKAKPKRLLVIADGPRIEQAEDQKKCAETRAIINRVDWNCEVIRNFSDVNMGCKLRISSGLDWVFGMVEEAIILEDDCLPDPSFFKFCELMLEKYRNDERIMMISGTNLLTELKIKESYVFSRYFAIWGWASWRRAWAYYDINMTDWNTLKEQGQLKSFYSQKYMEKYVELMFNYILLGDTLTWDIQWFYSCLFNNGLCIVPKVNLISNIGLVGTHTSGDKSNNFLPLFSIDNENFVHPKMVFPNNLYDEKLYWTKFKFVYIGAIKSKVIFFIKYRINTLIKNIKNIF